jgi:hypothetical protein
VVFGAKRLGAGVVVVAVPVVAAVVFGAKRLGAGLVVAVPVVAAVVFGAKRLGAEVAVVDVEVLSDVVVAGLNPEKRDWVAGAALEAGVALVAAPVLSPVIFPPRLNMEPVVVGAGTVAAVGSAVALEVGKNPNKGFACVPPVEAVGAGAAPALEVAGVVPKILLVLVVFCPPKIFPVLGCGIVVFEVVSVVFGAPKRFPVAPPSLFPPNTFVVVFGASLGAIGVPAGVVEGAKLNMLPGGLVVAGVVVPNKLPDAAGALSVLFRVGNKFVVGVELGFWAELSPKEKVLPNEGGCLLDSVPAPKSPLPCVAAPDALLLEVVPPNTLPPVPAVAVFDPNNGADVPAVAGEPNMDGAAVDAGPPKENAGFAADVLLVFPKILEV